jgi:adenylate cyclase
LPVRGSFCVTPAFRDLKEPHLPSIDSANALDEGNFSLSGTERMIRQLTAIMFADMVGYTALMQEDERLAKANRDRNRDVLVRRVKEHGGEILQFYGDGTLSVFQSAIAAVECGIQIQADLRTPPEIPVRVGIHTGDIIRDDDGVFGDGVNLAARIQGLAIPGSVLISEKVFDDVKNQPEIRTRSLGSFAVKNVKKPMEVWAIAHDALAMPDPGAMGSRPQETALSVAVLPFMNMSSDPENEFFSDGITEEIINVLTRVNGLQVTARTSSFAFRGQNRDVREIGVQLGVSTVLEGSVRRAGDRVRITAQLINTQDGYHLFSKSYDRDLQNIFETQDEISQTIVEELKEHFPGCVGAKSTLEVVAPAGGERHFHDTEAYTEYLKGLHHWNRWTPEGARQAIQRFERSIELDPDCGLPHSAMANAYTFLAAIGHLQSSIAYPRAREAALRAVELEEGSGESYAALAVVKLFHDWDFQEAYRYFQKALSKTPGAAQVRQLYALYLTAIGEHEAAEEELLTAIELDPLSPTLRTSLGEVYLHAGRLEEAQRQLRRVLELDPEFRSAREVLGWAYVAQGRPREALDEFEEIPRRTGDPFKAIPHRAYALAKLGREGEARQLGKFLEERQEREPEVSLQIDFAILHLALGEPERALDFLEEAVDERLGVVVMLRNSLMWRELHTHPRFQRLLERIGGPPAGPSP